ncbi:MAG: cadmium-translocating P-type ATPase [Sphaerochaetaceae bacterium]|nr:cadmium-translocating P-type ATPase [Sphaerochaetaceae bacterium]
MYNYVFPVEIDCAHCASKVENALNKNSQVEKASFDFERGKLSVTTTLSREMVKAFCKEVEEDIVFLDDEKSYCFSVEIDCANCAKKVEDKLNSTEGIRVANFDFPNGKLSVKGNLSEAEIKSICLSVEEDMVFKSIEKKEEQEKRDIRPYRIIVAIVIMSISSFFSFRYGYILSYLIAGYDVIYKAFRNILKGKIFDENFLMGIATIGALLLGEYTEASAVMVFYQVGEYFQDRAVRKSRRSIKNLMDLTPEECTVIRNGENQVVSPEAVKVGETILVKAGERVALDGRVTKGDSYLDTSSITGESVKRGVHKGDNVLSGSVNTTGVLEIEVTKNYENSTTKRILDMVEKNSDKKAPTEKFITHFARYYTPIVCLLALVLALLPPLFGAAWSTSIYRALMLLVVSCPCALVLSVPLSYFASIGAFAKKGILVKGADSIQKVAKLQMMAFDKTGTLTKGTFKVNKVVNLKDVEILPLLIALENNSEHPIAKAVISSGESNLTATDVSEIPGSGIKGTIDGSVYYAVKPSYYNLALEEKGTVAVLGDEKEALGYVVISDEIKAEAIPALVELKKLGVKKLVMLTGDRKESTDEVASAFNLDSVVSDLLPDEKVEAFEKERIEGISGFAGDGINDAVLLSTADVGIAMGGVGSDAAIEAADMVIMNDDISRIGSGIKLSRRTERIVKQNIIFSILVKILIILLAIVGLANMWLAIFGDVGVALICVINAMRCLSSSER